MLTTLLRDSWSFFKNHVLILSIIILPVAAPIEILIALYQYSLAADKEIFTQKIIPMVIAFGAYPIYTIGVIFYIASIISGEKIEIKTLWRLGIRYWHAYIALSLLVSAVVITGFMLFVLPGILFTIRYSFSEFELLLNRRKPLEAMKKSWGSTKEYMWILFAGYAVITITLNVPYFLLTDLIGDTGMSHWVFGTLLNIVYSVLTALHTIFAFRVYEFAKLQHKQAHNN